jgi:hypothetical protein
MRPKNKGQFSRGNEQEKKQAAGSLWGNPGTRHQVYRRSFGEYAIWFSWLFIQSRAGQQSADMKNPGAVSRPGYTS